MKAARLPGHKTGGDADLLSKLQASLPDEAAELRVSVEGMMRSLQQATTSTGGDPRHSKAEDSADGSDFFPGEALISILSPEP